MTAEPQHPVKLRRKRTIICDSKVFAETKLNSEAARTAYKSGDFKVVHWEQALGPTEICETRFLSKTGKAREPKFCPTQRVQSQSSHPISETLETYVFNGPYTKPKQFQKKFWKSATQLVSMSVGTTQQTKHVLYVLYLVDPGTGLSTRYKTFNVGITMVGDKAHIPREKSDGSGEKPNKKGPDKQSKKEGKQNNVKKFCKRFGRKKKAKANSTE